LPTFWRALYLDGRAVFILLFLPGYEGVAGKETTIGLDGVQAARVFNRESASGDAHGACSCAVHSIFMEML
jgi:hypothetical protein